MSEVWLYVLLFIVVRLCLSLQCIVDIAKSPRGVESYILISLCYQITSVQYSDDWVAVAGALDAWTIHVVPKHNIQGSGNKNSYKSLNQPFEQTFRLQVILQ